MFPFTLDIYCTSVRPGREIPHMWLSLRFLLSFYLLKGFFSSFSLLLLRVKGRGCHTLLKPYETNCGLWIWAIQIKFDWLIDWLNRKERERAVLAHQVYSTLPRKRYPEKQLLGTPWWSCLLVPHSFTESPCGPCDTSCKSKWMPPTLEAKINVNFLHFEQPVQQHHMAPYGWDTEPKKKKKSDWEMLTQSYLCGQVLLKHAKC